MPSYCRADTLEPIDIGSRSDILYGDPKLGQKVHRAALFKNPGKAPARGLKSSRAPYLPVSPQWAIQLINTPTDISKREVRLQFLLRRDGNRCAYCGEKLEIQTITTEHVLPTSADGPDNACNLTLACGPCNRAVEGMTCREKIEYAVRMRSKVALEMIAKALGVEP